MIFWYILLGLIVFLVILFVILAKARRPDQLLLIEKHGTVQPYLKRWYFSKSVLALPATVKTISTEVKTQARGKIDVIIKLSVSFFPDPERAGNLIRVGGWTPDAVDRVAQELSGTVQGLVGELVEPLNITQVTREKLSHMLRQKLQALAPSFGITVTSVVVSDAEAADQKIADAIRKQEEARIQEEMEKSSQRSRIATEKLRLAADDEIERMKHKMEMEHLKLREIEELKAAELEQKLLEKETEKKRLTLALEQEEAELLSRHPELMMLTPQLTRLVEASQQLKSAKTVISLSPEIQDGLPRILQTLLELLQSRKGQEKES
ncbi:MAG: hypothetical protein GXO76_09165 [Calditrichaeota bacterium]|nr:hypothetical protein [Calditrichota bacterium]